MHIKNLHADGLQIDELATHPGESWCIFGRNRSGIDSLVALLSGRLPAFAAEILDLPEHPGLVSFQVQQDIFEEELRNDDTDILDRLDPGTPARAFLPQIAAHRSLLKAFGMEQCLDAGFRQLSSGQCRKLLLLRELTGGATSLLLQNPYDGLDAASCHELDQALRRLPGRGIEVIVIVSSIADIPAWCTHLALIDSGRLLQAGLREQVLPQIVSLLERTRPGTDPPPGITFPAATLQDGKEELVVLQNGSAGYNGTPLFSGLHIRICTGDHTLISGPNGCGKSTLLDIITGDNPGCYTNALRLFGKPRGSGESIWDIKKQMGIISPGLHRDHRVPGSALAIVLSGLHDSIGLYTKVGASEKQAGRSWLDWLGLGDRADTPFRHLPFAEQRLVLIARALIKQPKLLILDEPTQGLDDFHRHALLALLEKIAEHRLSTLLFVSHRNDERRPFFRRHIRLDTYACAAP